MPRSNRHKKGGYAYPLRYFDQSQPLYPDSSIPNSFVSAGNNAGGLETNGNLYPYNAYAGAVEVGSTPPLPTIGPTTQTTVASCTGGAKVRKTSNTRRRLNRRRPGKTQRKKRGL